MGGTPAVDFVTLGCKVNQSESDAIAEQLGALCTAEEDAGRAGVIVVNTCTVTGEADAKARKAVRRALARPDEPLVVVTGCLAAVDPDGVAALGHRVVVEPDKALVASRVRSLVGGTSGDMLPRSERSDGGSGPLTAARRARVQVKVQDGCDAFCAYCIVPYARGVPRSVAIDDVVRRVERLRETGTGEVVLTGINIGRYDHAGIGLPGLLARVAATGMARVRLSSVEPDDVTPALLEAMAHPAVAAHLHVPLQSGCDETLAVMGRRYDTARFASIVGRIREALPGAAITTDLLVGFPGETDAHFERTLAFVGDMGFTRLHVFRYSARPGTVAADLPDQVPSAIRAERAARARALGDAQARAWAAAHVGRDIDVLVERIAGGRAEGTSAEYLRATFDAAAPEAADTGDIVRVHVTAADGASVVGERER